MFRVSLQLVKMSETSECSLKQLDKCGKIWIYTFNSLCPMITKPCPFCGKLITLHALMCQHCQTVNPFVKAVKRERFKNVCLTAIVITLAGVVIWFSF